MKNAKKLAKFTTWILFWHMPINSKNLMTCVNPAQFCRFYNVSFHRLVVLFATQPALFYTTNECGSKWTLQLMLANYT